MEGGEDLHMLREQQYMCFSRQPTTATLCRIMLASGDDRHHCNGCRDPFEALGCSQLLMYEC